MWRWLGELVDEVLMANPGRLKIISQTAYKDDRTDAQKLAGLWGCWAWYPAALMKSWAIRRSFGDSG